MKITKSKFYKLIIKEALEADNLTLQQALDRFMNEKQVKTLALFDSIYNHKLNPHKELLDWLTGLALDVPYMNYEVLILADELGLHDESTRESTKEKLIQSYWVDLEENLMQQFRLVK